MVKKHTHRGKTTWCFVFDVPGSTRDERRRVRKFGFATKKEAEAAETAARIELDQKEGGCLKNPASKPRTLDELFKNSLPCTQPTYLPLPPSATATVRRI